MYSDTTTCKIKNSIETIRIEILSLKEDNDTETFSQMFSA